MHKTSEYYSVEEAAEWLGLKVQTVRNYLATGKIRKTKLKTLTMISKKDLVLFKYEQERQFILNNRSQVKLVGADDYQSLIGSPLSKKDLVASEYEYEKEKES